MVTSQMDRQTNKQKKVVAKLLLQMKNVGLPFRDLTQSKKVIISSVILVIGFYKKKSLGSTINIALFSLINGKHFYNDRLLLENSGQKICFNF